MVPPGCLSSHCRDNDLWHTTAYCINHPIFSQRYLASACRCSSCNQRPEKGRSSRDRPRRVSSCANHRHRHFGDPETRSYHCDRLAKNNFRKVQDTSVAAAITPTHPRLWRRVYRLCLRGSTSHARRQTGAIDGRPSSPGSYELERRTHFDWLERLFAFAL